MSGEMEISGNLTNEDAKICSDEAIEETTGEVKDLAADAASDPQPEQAPKTATLAEDKPSEDISIPTDNIEHSGVFQNIPDEAESITSETESKPELQLDFNDHDQKEKEEKLEMEDQIEEKELKKEMDIVEEKSIEERLGEIHRGVKRRASVAFSDGGDEEFMGFDSFKGFEESKVVEVTENNTKISKYSKVLERLEAEVHAVTKDYTPLRLIMGTPSGPVRATKRLRQDTDGSRPSSALSSRSEGDGTDAASSASSPAYKGRRVTTEMSSPLLRVPLEKGWKRELVYRATMDPSSKKNADIYYYTPQGKKLRSTREVSEHLYGTGLTLENFSFFKEPLGVDDPEREIIRDAKMIRRVESPVSAAPVLSESKRTPKPKPPKGASPEPPTTKSPPAKIKVKSVGSRLSGSGPAPTPPAKQQKKQPPANIENNNTAAWKKPRAAAEPEPRPHLAPQPHPHPQPQLVPHPQLVPQQPPPLQSRPSIQPTSPDVQAARAVQPCSMSCGRGAVPSLACAACLCLYHPVCVKHVTADSLPFYCKNCRKSSSPPVEPPPLTHKSGVTGNSAPLRRAPPTHPPLPLQRATKQQDKRVTLRMKVSGGPGGERVWEVARGGPGRTVSLPQSLALLNGRRFIIVPRAAPHADTPH